MGGILFCTVACIGYHDKPDPAPHGATGATDLEAEVWCSATQVGKGLVRFGWSSHAHDADQRLDVSEFRGGLERGEYDSIAHMSPEERSVTWDGGTPGINYYWRVVTIWPHHWVASEVERFKSPVCPADFEPEASGVVQ